MRMNRMRKLKAKLAAICTAGVLFQGLQCNLDSENLVPGLVQTVGSIFVSSYVSDLFSVAPSFF